MPRTCPLYDHLTPGAPVARDGKKNGDELTSDCSPSAHHRRWCRGPPIGPAGPPVPVGRHTRLRSRRTLARQQGRPCAETTAPVTTDTEPQPPCRRFSTPTARSPIGHANTASTPRNSTPPRCAHFAPNHFPERGNAHGIGNTIELDSACSASVNRPDEPLTAEPSPCSASTCFWIIGGVHTVVKQLKRFSPESSRVETTRSRWPQPCRALCCVDRNPPFAKNRAVPCDAGNPAPHGTTR